jgi:tetratricopeptide (TPR) repeat protein
MRGRCRTSRGLGLVLAIALVRVASAQPAPEQPAPEQPQTPAPSPNPEPSPDPGAAPATEIEAPEPEAPEVAEARQYFRQGVAFTEAGNCGAAIVAFEAAYALVPRPNALYNIGQCQERLFRYDLAIQFYQRYLQETPADADDVPAVEAALRTLNNLLGTLHVRSNVPAEVWVDDRLAGSAPGDVFVPAGEHSVELRATGYISERAEVRLVGRQALALSFQLVKAQPTVQVTETTGLEPMLFWIGAGATALTACIGTFYAVRALSLHDDALALPDVHPERTERREAVENAEITADIFFASAALLAIGTTIVFLVTDWQAGERTARDAGSEPAVRVVPVIAPRAAGFSIGGRL